MLDDVKKHVWDVQSFVDKVEKLKTTIENSDTNKTAIDKIITKAKYIVNTPKIELIINSVDRILINELKSPGLVAITKLIVCLECISEVKSEYTKKQILEELAQGTGMSYELYKLIEEEWATDINYSLYLLDLLGRETFATKTAILVTYLVSKIIDTANNNNN